MCIDGKTAHTPLFFSYPKESGNYRPPIDSWAEFMMIFEFLVIVSNYN